MSKTNNAFQIVVNIDFFTISTSKQCWHFLEYKNWKHIFQIPYSSIPINFFWNTNGILEYNLKYWNIKNYFEILEFNLEY